GEGLRIDREAEPVVVCCAFCGFAYLLHDGLQCFPVGGSCVQPRADQGGDGVGAVGGDVCLGHGGAGVVLFGRCAGGQNGVGEGHHGGGPIDRAGGPGVVGPTPQVHSPASVWPEGTCHTDGVLGVLQGPALLHVEFDEHVVQ